MDLFPSANAHAESRHHGTWLDVEDIGDEHLMLNKKQSNSTLLSTTSTLFESAIIVRRLQSGHYLQ